MKGMIKVAATIKWFGKVPMHALQGEINVKTHPLKVILVDSTYVPDQDNHEFRSHVLGEVTGTGYTAGGKQLTNVSIAYDAATNRTVLMADDVVWQNSTLNARYGIIYDDNDDNPANKPLLMFIDFGEDIVSRDGDFKILFNLNGFGWAEVQ